MSSEATDLTDEQVEKFFGELDRVNGKLVAEPPPEVCKEACTELFGEERWRSCRRGSVRVEEYKAGGAGGGCTTYESCERVDTISCSKDEKFDGCGF